MLVVATEPGTPSLLLSYILPGGFPASTPPPRMVEADLPFLVAGLFFTDMTNPSLVAVTWANLGAIPGDGSVL